MEVTFWKQWIHFLLSERWPPTSTILLGGGGTTTAFTSGDQTVAQDSSRRSGDRKRVKHESRMANG